jgi:hypothetical protein
VDLGCQHLINDLNSGGGKGAFWHLGLPQPRCPLFKLIRFLPDHFFGIEGYVGGPPCMREAGSEASSTNLVRFWYGVQFERAPMGCL